MNKIHCSTLKEPDLWMNTVYFEKRKKKSPYLPTHRWNEGSGAGNKHIFKGGLIIFNFIMYFLCFMLTVNHCIYVPCLSFIGLLIILSQWKRKKNFTPYTVQLKWKTQSPCLIKDYRNAELTSSPCVYVDGPRNNMDMTDRTRCLHESITDCNYWNVHS